MGDGEQLFSGALVVDPSSLREMRPGAGATLVDAIDARDARILIVRRAWEAGDAAQDGTVAVRLQCSFHAPPGSRYTRARVVLKLTEPRDAVFFDISPHEVKEPTTVEVSRASKLKLSVKLGSLGVSVEPGGESSTKSTRTSYVCRVQGSGDSTPRAQWTFEELDGSEEGIGLDQIVTMIVPSGSPVKAELLVTARLARRGLPGALDMIIGRQDEVMKPQITLYESA
jgi:hypothetical protein